MEFCVQSHHFPTARGRREGKWRESEREEKLHEKLDRGRQHAIRLLVWYKVAVAGALTFPLLRGS